MTTYSNTNRGVLFKENNKKSENSPDYSGNIHVGDDKYWLSGWIREKDGTKHLSLSVSPHQDGPQEQGNGILEPNTSKSSDRQPDYKGNVTVGDSTMGIAAWKKVSTNGEKQFISISVDARQESRQPEHVASQPCSSHGAAEDDDYIPF